MIGFAGGRKNVDSLSRKMAKIQSEHKYGTVRSAYFTGTKPHGITFEDDYCTVKEVAKDSQAYDQGVEPGWKIFKLETNDGTTYTQRFQDILDNENINCHVLFGLSEKLSLLLTQEEEANEDNGCVHVNARLLITRLYNCNIPQETFEADVFVEFMWLAPWDLSDWKNYLHTLEKHQGYNHLLKQLRIAEWDKPDGKEFLKPSTREEEVYYSERIVQSYDRQAILPSTEAASSFRPIWLPRIVFTNLKNKSYDEMNFGSDAFSMVNIGNHWYTVWRRNITDAVFYETYELKNFPYDIQELTISLLCTHPNTRVKLLSHKCYRSPCVVLETNIMLPEWRYLGMRCSVGDDESGRFSVFKFEAEIRRLPDYFIKSGQYIFMCITIVSFLVFGIPANHDYIGERLSYGSTMLLTTVAFKWLISEKIPNLPYDTYLDDYSQWGFYIQILIMLVNGSMIFVRIVDEDGELDTNALHVYDHTCFAVIFSIWAIYQFYAYIVRVPRIIKEESARLLGMTEARHEKVEKKFLMKVTGRRKSTKFNLGLGARNTTYSTDVEKSVEETEKPIDGITLIDSAYLSNEMMAVEEIYRDSQAII